MAVVVDPERGSPRSSTRNTRSASPSKASPTSAPTSRTRACRSRRFSGWIGSAGWFGNVPSSSPKRISRSNGQAREHRGDDQPAHAVGGVGHDLERPQRAEVDERPHVVGEGARAGRGTASRRPGRRRGQRRPRPVALISREPGVLADRPGAGQAELDAVVLGRVVRGGEHGARRVELAGGEVQQVGGGQAEVDDVERPGPATPSAKAAASSTPEAACPGPRGPAGPAGRSAAKRANAAPTARATSASSWSGTVPRMS